MEIKDSHIIEAETILLKGKGTFDEERIDFIKNLSSIDLLAVPGSGKTTALNAKLYCIAKNLPLSDGSGILVLSHTNAAVDEVKRRLQGVCPELFMYPNFIGTIQDFIDTFLALPYYQKKYGKKVNCIDDVLYLNAWEPYIDSFKHIYHGLWGCKKFINDIRLCFDEHGEFISDGVDGGKLSFGDYKCWNKLTPEQREEEKEKLYSFLISSKQKFMNDGIWHFDDCYYFANKYLNEHPEIINIIRKRFKYIFVDEAQDMSSYQLAIIDKLFNCDEVVLQRIGDPNQSIYSSNGTDCDWVARNPHFLSNSLRLTQDIASLVDCLVLNPGLKPDGTPQFIVIGKRELASRIPPTLVLYDENTESKLKETFCEEIAVLNLQNIPESLNGFHIIGWNASSKDDGPNKHLEDIFLEYKKDLKSAKQSYDTLSEFVNSCRYDNTYNNAQRVVKQILCKVLRLVGKRDIHGRYINISTLKSYVDSIDKRNVELLERIVLNTSTLLVRKKYNDAFDFIKQFLQNDASQMFDAEFNDAVDVFIGEAYTPLEDEGDGEVNALDIPVTIGTVHSVKGMTHCATMYVETYYRKKYEGERIIQRSSSGRGRNRVVSFNSPLFHDHITFVNSEAYKRTLKMMYVGFSRPTHLLCYASHVDRWSQELVQLMLSNGWKIKNISNTHFDIAEPLF